MSAKNQASSKPLTDKPKRKTPAGVTAYLVFYNVLSALGWSYLLGLLIIHLFNLDGNSTVLPQPTPSLVKTQLSRLLSFLSPGRNVESTVSLQSKLPPALQPIVARAATAYGRLGNQTRIVQSFAALEILHALLGWVRSPVTTTAMQVASRLLLVWDVTYLYPTETHTNPVFASMVLAWSVTEVIRYSFYALGLVGSSSSVLVWLRYTTFYILYPLGAGSEAFIMLATTPRTFLPACLHTLAPQPFANWTVDQLVHYFLFFIWWPGLAVMYNYMIGQRRKVLGPKKTLKTQ